MEVEQTAYQIVAALTPNAAGMQPGMTGMNMNGGMQPGMTGMNVNGGMQRNSSSWECQCGAENTGKFCEYCGQPRPF